MSQRVQDAAAVRAKPGYLEVVVARQFVDLEEARAMQSQIDREVAAHELSRVLFDYRGVGAHAEEVRESMWQWAHDAQFEAIALVVDSELTRVRVNMTALARRVPMRAFVREADAMNWLLDPEQRRPTREVKPL